MSIKPNKLRKGDTIGVVSPASPSDAKSEIIRAVETLEDMGFKVEVGKNVNKTKGLVAASEEDRADDINYMFRSDHIDAIMVTQGGYGSAQIINRLDYDVIANNPKIFCGYSDITSLHLAIKKYADIVTFHGPGMARFNSEDLTKYTKKYFFKATTEAEPIGQIKKADEKKWINSIAPGKCRGEVIGGNVTLVCASLGTPYEIDTKGKIFLIEDLDTEPWIFDHMLSHLRNAGKLSDVAGVVIGECKDCVPFDYKPGFVVDWCLEDALSYYLADLGVPVLYGLPLGHTEDLATVPFSVMAELDADNKSFSIVESGVE